MSPFATRHHMVSVAGQQIFYREAGDPSRPTLVLLHGFPTSSHMFRNLIPALADEYHLVAPDHVGFGNSSAPPVDGFDYSFERLTGITLGLLDTLGIDRFALYVHDYGAPIGLRIASRHPERVTALVTQSGNAYTEGFTPFWDVLFAHAKDRATHEPEVRRLLEVEATRWQYTHGVPADRLDRVAPETWRLDQAGLDGRATPRSSSSSSGTTSSTSTSTPTSSATCASTGRRPWSPGAATTRSSAPPEPRRTPGTCPTPRSTCWTPATSRWRPTATRSPG